jgi:hypothetical protein
MTPSLTPDSPQLESGLCEAGVLLLWLHLELEKDTYFLEEQLDWERKVKLEPLELWDSLRYRS